MPEKLQSKVVSERNQVIKHVQWGAQLGRMDTLNLVPPFLFCNYEINASCHICHNANL